MNKKSFSLFIVILFILFCRSAPVDAYDATGEWDYSTSNSWNTCDPPDPEETGSVTLTQSGNTFTLTIHGGTVDGKIYKDGVVYDATYTISYTYPFNAPNGIPGMLTEEIVITLSSNSAGSGTYTGTWVADNIDFSCGWGFNLTLTKQVDGVKAMPWIPLLLLDEDKKLPLSGNWSGSADFGELSFTVNATSTGITKITINYIDFSCGPVTKNGSFTTQYIQELPINNGQFTMNKSSPNDDFTLSGMFNQTGMSISGTYKAIIYGTICEGNWNATPN